MAAVIGTEIWPSSHHYVGLHEDTSNLECRLPNDKFRSLKTSSPVARHFWVTFNTTEMESVRGLLLAHFTGTMN